jgi:hypothetical protein
MRFHFAGATLSGTFLYLSIRHSHRHCCLRTTTDNGDCAVLRDVKRCRPLQPDSSMFKHQKIKTVALELGKSGIALLSMCTSLLIFSSLVWAQKSDADFLNPLGLAELKNYSAARVSSGNRYVLSNDDSKRIMPGETFAMANLTGPGMVTHIWLTVADNEFGWARLVRIRVYYDGHKTPSVDAPLGDFFAVGHGSERDVNSMMVRDSSFGRARNSYWPMPFRKSCRITVTNEGKRLFMPTTDKSVLPAVVITMCSWIPKERATTLGPFLALFSPRFLGSEKEMTCSMWMAQNSHRFMGRGPRIISMTLGT